MCTIFWEDLWNYAKVYQGVASGLAVETYVLKLNVSMCVAQFMKYLKLACELHANFTKLLEGQRLVLASIFKAWAKVKFVVYSIPWVGH